MLTPVVDGSACVVQIHEPMQVQAGVAKTSVEALHGRVLRRLAGLDEVQLHATFASPEEHRLAAQLWSVVQNDRLRLPLPLDHLVQLTRNAYSGERDVYGLADARLGEVVDDVENAETSPVAELAVTEVQ